MLNHRMLGLIALCALLGACGSGQQAHHPQAAQASNSTASDDSALPPMAQSDTGEFHHNDPCSMLKPAEVEAAFGAPLGTPPFRGGSLGAGSEIVTCAYMTRDFQAVTLEVDFEGGQKAYHIGDFVGNAIKSANNGVISDKGKQAMISDAGEEIAGDWDEASLLPLSCCVFHALRGDQMIAIDFTGSTMSLKQAAGLVDAAFKRIDKPLGLDGGANVAAAKAFLKTRPQPKAPCSVLTQGEVEAIVGKLASAPKASSDACSYALPRQPDQIPRVYELEFIWHDGNYQFRQDLQVARMGGAALGGMNLASRTQVQAPDSSTADSARPSSGAHTQEVVENISLDQAAKRASGESFSQAGHLTGEQDSAGTGPWERSAFVGGAFEAVKKDMLVKIELFGIDKDRARALVAQAMKKL